MKNKVFSVLQRVGQSFMLPIAILPVAGLLVGIGSSLTSLTTIETYGLTGILGEGTMLYALLVIMSKVGGIVFDNLPLIFAVGVAIGMAKKEKEVAALSSVIAYFVMNTAINAMLTISGQIMENGQTADTVLEGTITTICGMQTLQMGVFGGIIVGLGVAALHNKFYRIQLPHALAFFGGTRFVPMISTFVYMIVGILMYYIWPMIQNGIYELGGVITGSGYMGTLFFGLIKRVLIPFGLHHIFYVPFWQTAVGGTMEVAGQTIQGGQNIFFAQLADSANIAHFSADATRFFTGEYIFMIFGLPGAALAMYRCAKPEKKEKIGALLFSAALTCMVTGITEPLEFSFLFAAPILFGVQVLLAGSTYMIAHMLNIAVGMTFSGGILEFILYGVLQGNEKTNWMLVIPVGIIYFFLYYFIFKSLILKFDLKTPGREDADTETKLYSKADMNVQGERQTERDEETISEAIVKGLGGKENISDVDCCATRLRCTVLDASRVNDAVLKETGAAGVVHRGKGVQLIYGPHVTVIKSNLEEYLTLGKETIVKNIQVTIDEQQEVQYDEKKIKIVKSIVISSPVNGLAADLSTVPDVAFAERMMGDGVAITPQDSFVYAPEDGEVAFVFDTNHAVGFLTDSGISLLIHIGVDTVQLKGKGFEALVQAGQKVKKGDPMLKLDLDYLKEHAPSIISPILCTELKENERIHLVKEGNIRAGETLFTIDIWE